MTGPRLSALPWPHTLRAMAMGGMIIVLLPMLAAVAYASVKLDQLARLGQTIVEDSMRATQNSQRVLNQLTQLERHARQYLVLGDPALLELLEQTRGELEATLDELAVLPQDEETLALRESLSGQAHVLAGMLVAPTVSDAERGSELGQRLEALAGTAGSLSRGMRRVMDQELAALRGSVRRTREVLLWQTLLLAPALTLMMGFLYLQVLRPLRQIDAAIEQLGEERLEKPISVDGPQDLRALGRQLEWLRERMQELAMEKNRFLRHMSHELKTPLANIREGTELLLDGAVGELEPRQEEVTRILRDNGIRLQQLIENLLSFSAWQSRNARLELSEFRIADLFREVLRRHRLVLASQQLKLKSRIQDLEINADHAKLGLVLENLVSNAIKYSPRRGAIHLGAAADGEWLQIDVADDGPGIPAEERHRVFEAFYQGSQRATTHVGGTGIGLSVVLECVTAHGGTVQIVDGEYRGAHFRVRLPQRQTNAASPTTLAARRAGGAA